MDQIERDKDGRAHIVALSGGKDSTAMALRLAESEPHNLYTYVCTPTGDELPEMIHHWKKLEGILGKRIVPIYRKGGLKKLCEEQNALPNFRMRFCTRMLKLYPYTEWIQNHLPAVSYVGLRADEPEEAREGMRYNTKIQEQLSVRYPLREWGWDIDAVWDYLDQKGIEIPDQSFHHSPIFW